MTLPLGGYTGTDTPAAQVDARVKLALLVLCTVCAFLVPAWGLALMAVLLGAVARAARMPLASVARGLKPVAVILAFTLVANALRLDGSGAWVLAGPVGVSPEGLARGTAAVARIALLVGFALTVSASTTSTELADACTAALRPLGALGVPVGDFGVTLSLALRFVPLVAEELERIRLAQRARGVRFDTGGVISRVRAWAAVVTPLAVSLFRRADALSEAMDARCYTGGSRRLPRRAPLAGRDVILLAAGLIVTAAAIMGALFA